MEVIHPKAELLPGMREPCSWDRVFLNICWELSTKSKDASTQCGAVLVAPDKHILACGFNGPPSEIVDDLVPWTERPQKYAYILHAEENAMWDAVGSYGFDKVKGSSMYCTHAPCSECVCRMIKLKLKEVVIPVDSAAYPLSKFLVNPEEIIDKQTYPKLAIRMV